jgi:hypothetical protein
VGLLSRVKLARSERDVRDACIKAPWRKGYTMGPGDVQTHEIWFEAKDTGKHVGYAMFTDRDARRIQAQPATRTKPMQERRRRALGLSQCRKDGIGCT